MKRWRLRRQGPPGNSRGPAQTIATTPAFAGMPDSPNAAALGLLMRTATTLSRQPQSAGPSGAAAGGHERRRVGEPYRQPFGREYTRRYGRPVGWLLVAGAVEKIFFPVALLLMLLLRQWEALFVTMAAESVVALAALVLVTKGQRLQYFFKGLAAIPLRYVLIAAELVTVGRFATDLWITKNRNWRK